MELDRAAGRFFAHQFLHGQPVVAKVLHYGFHVFLHFRTRIIKKKRGKYDIIIEHLVLLYWHCLPGVNLGVIGVVSAKEQRRSLK